MKALIVVVGVAAVVAAIWGVTLILQGRWWGAALTVVGLGYLAFDRRRRVS